MKKKILLTFILLIGSLVMLSSCRGCEEHPDFEVISVQPANCREEGYKILKCTECGKKVREIIPVTHDFNDKIIEKATCTNPGYRERVCKICQYKTKEEYIDPDAHIYTNGHVIKEATCTTPEIYIPKCSLCDEVMSKDHPKYKEREGKLKPHNYINGICSECNKEEVYKMSFYINNDLYKTIEFTAATYKDVVTPEFPTMPGMKIKGWEEYDFNYNNIRVDAIIELYEYQIIYKNMDSIENPNPIKYTINDVIVLEQPVRKGYIFNGFYDEFNNKVETIDVSLAKDITLYANWEVIYYDIEIDVDYSKLYINSNNKNDLNFDSIPKTYTVNDEIITLPALELGGYKFGGWTNLDTNTRIYNIYPSYDLKDIRIAPIFNPITYKVKLNTEGELYNDEVSVTFGTMIKMPIPSKLGYKFGGWYYNDDLFALVDGWLDEKYGYFNDIEVTSTFNIIEYKIEIVNERDIDLPEIPLTYTILSDTIKLPTPLNYGFKFIGWKDLNTNEYITEIPTGSTKDYKIQLDIAPYQYNYTLYNGDEVVHNGKFSYGDKLTLKVTGLNKTGYQLDGWYLGDTKVFYADGDSVNPLKYAEDIILNAKWNIIDYQISLKSNIEYDLSKLNVPQTHNILSSDIHLPNLEVDGYTFKGWKNLENNEFVTVIKGQTIGQYKLEATFEPNKYVVTLSDGTEYVVEYNKSYKLPVLEKEGHSFVGWYNSNNMYTDNKGNSIENYKDLQNITLIPKYDINSYTIKYYYKDKLIVENTYDYNTVIKNFKPSKVEGNVFIGWYDANDNLYNDSFILKENIELYAKYEEGYEISTAEEFFNISNNPTANYVLTNNISFNGMIIGKICDFSGKLFGNGYALSDFIMNASSVSGNYGIFTSNSGIIKEIKLKDFTFNIGIADSQASVGILTGTNTGIIDNIIIDGAISNITSKKTDSLNYFKYGCITGNNSGTITNCNVSATTTISLSYYTNPEFHDQGHNNFTNYYIGGITGYNTKVVENCIVTSSTNVTSYIDIYSSGYKVPRPYNKNYFGGLVGVNSGENAIVSRCFADSKYEYSYSEKHHDRWYTYSVDNEVETLYLGGLVGCNTAKAMLELSSSVCEVNGNTKWTNYIGGLVGSNTDIAYVKSSYTNADINAYEANHHAINIGGLIGYNAANVLNCYSKGEVETNRSANIGGLVGANTSNGSIVKSYAAVDVIAKSGKAGKFVGYSDGAINKGYEVIGSNLVLNDASPSKLNQTSVVTTKEYSEIINPTFLKEILSWDMEGWYIDGSINPLLTWEIDVIHNFEVIQITEKTCVYPAYEIKYCSHCDTTIMEFVKDEYGNVDLPSGHESLESFVVPPTCLEEGYTKHICKNCADENGDPFVYYDSYVSQTGHSLPDEIYCDDNNLIYEDGVFKYKCINKDCNEYINVNAKDIIHENFVDIPYEDASCGIYNPGTGESTGEVIGHTGGRYCNDSDCAYYDVINQVYYIKENKEFESHDYKETIIQQPTCHSVGLATKTCRLCGKVLENCEIEMLEHTSKAGSIYCQVKECGALLYNFNGYQAIKTPQDLLDMSPYGRYYLANDIDMTDITYTPIGTSKNPFVGEFIGIGSDGHQHKIKNLTLNYSDKKDIYYGLFGKVGNNAVVSYITIENLNVVASNNKNAVIGGITGINCGTIYECNVTGEINITLKSSVAAKVNYDLTCDFKYTFGIITGENEGVVDSCKVSGNTYMNYILSSEVEGSFENLSSITSFGIAKNNTTIISGGLVGINKKQIINSTNESQYKNSNSFTTNIGGINKGQAYLNIKLYDGALVGINEKEIIDCNSVVKNNNIHTSNDDYYEYFDQLKIIVVQRLEQIKVTDYTVYEKYAGIIGYSDQLSTVTNLNN